MAVLFDAVGAWEAFIQTRPFPRRQATRQRVIDCQAADETVIDYGYYQNMASGSYDPNMVYDEDSGVGYFHLINGSASWLRESYTVVCIARQITCNVDGNGLPFATQMTFPEYTGGHQGEFLNINCNDNGSDTNSFTGQPYIAYAGLPVAAAIEWEGLGWLWFRVGVSPSMTIPHLRQATGIGDRLPEIDITVVIN